MDELDLPDDCWADRDGPLGVGDICDAMPYAVLVDQRLGRERPFDEDDRHFYVPVLHSYGLIVGRVGEYALVASVGTYLGVNNEDVYEGLIEHGRTAATTIRIPLIPNDPHDDWSGRDGVALLSLIESFEANDELRRRRVATMDDVSKDLLRRRIARALAP